jgi:hypothetical protein
MVIVGPGSAGCLPMSHASKTAMTVAMTRNGVAVGKRASR